MAIVTDTVMAVCEDCRSQIVDQEEAVTVIRNRTASRFCSARCAAANLNPDWWFEIGVDLPE